MMFAGSAVLGPGRIGYRRLCWESEFYALTDQRLLVRKQWKKSPAAYELAQLRDMSIVYYSDQLATIVLTFRTGTRVKLQCLEFPDHCLRILQPFFTASDT